MTPQLTKISVILAGVALVVTLAAFILDHLPLTSAFALRIWQHMILDIWFLWLGLIVYGAVRFVRNLYLRFTLEINAIRDDLRREVSKRVELERRVDRVDELTKKLSTPPKREQPTPAELLVSSGGILPKGRSTQL